MNIPLNINFQQILLHLLNFAILAFGLYFILYKPVKKFMDKRAAGYEQMDSEAKNKLAEAEKVEAEYKAKLEDVDNELRAKRAEGDKAVAAARDAGLKQAQEEADKVLADARVKAEAEKSRIIASAQPEIAKLAAEAAEKIVNANVNDAYESFLKEAEKDDGND